MFSTDFLTQPLLLLREDTASFGNLAISGSPDFGGLAPSLSSQRLEFLLRSSAQLFGLGVCIFNDVIGLGPHPLPIRVSICDRLGPQSFNFSALLTQ